jgi:hypothetical protein
VCGIKRYFLASAKALDAKAVPCALLHKLRIQRPNSLPESVKNFQALRIFTQHKKFLAFCLADLARTHLPASRLKIFVCFPVLMKATMLSSSLQHQHHHSYYAR